MTFRNPYHEQIVRRLDTLKRDRGMRFWNELARAARMEPASLYAKINGKTGFTLEDIWKLEKALGSNIIVVVDIVHHADDDD